MVLVIFNNSSGHCDIYIDDRSCFLLLALFNVHTLGVIDIFFYSYLHVRLIYYINKK